MNAFRSFYHAARNRALFVTALLAVFCLTLAGPVPATDAEEIASTYRSGGVRIDGNIGLFEWRGLHTQCH